MVGVGYAPWCASGATCSLASSTRRRLPRLASLAEHECAAEPAAERQRRERDEREREAPAVTVPSS
jgi:hypothetical protein